jgi:hypothetical protein
VLAKVLPRLAPANAPQLLAAFSSHYQAAKALQFIRNAAAHHNAQTMADVLAIRSLYVAFPITHPTHALFWIEPTSSDFLALAAIQSLCDMGFDAIS